MNMLQALIFIYSYLSLKMRKSERLNIYADPQTEERLLGKAVLVGDKPIRTSLPFILNDIDENGLIPVKEQIVYVIESWRVCFVSLTELGKSRFEPHTEYTVDIRKLKNIGLLSSYSPFLNKKSTTNYIVDRFLQINGIEIY